MYHIDNPKEKLTVDQDWEAHYDIKDDLMSGPEWISECRECEKTEREGIPSDRDFAEKFCSGERYEYWDLELNNTCNLACRMCESQVSSTWQQQLQKNSTENWHSHYQKINKKLWFRGSAMQKIFEKIVFAKHVKFTGGEPFLIPQIELIVDHLINQNVAKNIYLKFISNGTQSMDRWVEKFECFDKVEIDVSLDGIGDRYEYIRPGAKWENVKSNIEFLVNNHSDKCKVTITTLPMILNYNNIDDVKKFANSLGIEHYIAPELTNPEFLSINTLYDRNLQKTFIEQMQIQDKIHNTNWQDFIKFS